MNEKMPMRRKDKELADVAEIVAVVDKCKYCRLAMCDGASPYIVPLNYGYRFEGGKLTLLFHSAREGRKMDILRTNPRVCFEMDVDGGLITAETACGHSYAFECVVGEGDVVFVEDHGDKTRALNEIMKHQTGKDVDHAYESAMLDRIAIYRVTADWFTGKRKVNPVRT